MTDHPIRLWRSPYSSFYGDEARHCADVYTEEYLREVAAEGFSGVWLRGVLRDLVRTDALPDLGGSASVYDGEVEPADDPAVYQEALGTVIDRADAAGVGVWLYLQPPQALPPDDPFWERHPEVEGATRDHPVQGEMTPLCVSTPAVRAFLRQGAERLSRRLPGLRGAILITASEHVQHCYTRFGRERIEAGESTGCERCDRRRPRDVIADVVGSVHEGFERADNGARVVAWNWSWNAYEPDPQPGIVRALPRDVTLMAGFERGSTREILGERRDVDEYALSFVGPSERFTGAVETARERGMETMAKLQVGTTHELATVPNLPVLGTLHGKAEGLRRLDVEHVMGCWNFGNLLTANTAAFLAFLEWDPLPPRREALTRFAADYFPGCRPAVVADAWETFGDAMEWYPFCIPFLYYGPLNHALARPIEPGPLDGEPVGRSWLPDSRGDDLSESLGPYTVDEIVTGLGRLWRTWTDGADRFDRGVADCDASTAREESNAVRVAGHCFRSGWNLYRAYRLRREWSPDDRDALAEIAADERDHVREVLPIVAADDRMGFHSECQQYMFDAESIRGKLSDLEALS